MTGQKGYLLLENGTAFPGCLLGDPQKTFGEVVFNTSMVGYEQVISDPSYAGQIVVMTYPLIGNYGVNLENMESRVPAIRALLVRELCPASGCQHYLQQMGLDEYLLANRIPCLTGVDTRAVTRMIRNSGTMGGVIVPSLDDRESVLPSIRPVLEDDLKDLVLQVGSREVTEFGSGSRHVVLMDFGTKKSIITAMVSRGFKVTVVPPVCPAQDILKMNPDGVILSNGPGDPSNCSYAVQTIAGLAGRLPIFGICLGHQLLALAMGGDTYKLPFGHRGGNHPVQDTDSGRVYITAQNHGYAVDENSIRGLGLKVSYRNLNDGTVEGLIDRKNALMSVQFHPEAAPGPEDTNYLFDEYLQMIA